MNVNAGARGWSAARRILCVRLDGMGDVLMTTPAMRAFRQSGEKRTLTLLASRAGAAIAPFIPEVSDTIEFVAPWMKPEGSNAARDTATIAELKSRRFDAAVIFTVYSQSPLPAAYLCYLAGIPLRLAHCRENPYHLLTDWISESEPERQIRHEVRRHLDLAAAVECRTGDERLSFVVPDSARERAAAAMRKAGIRTQSPLVVLHPGASAPSRRYPGSSFARAMDLVLERTEGAVVFTGSKDEVALVETIRAAMARESYSLAGRLGLAELGAVLERAALLVANNTGPVHMAAALGTPVVDLYALTNPQHTPWQVRNEVLYADVPCRYCYKSVCPAGHHGCLTRVSPECVADAAERLLRGSTAAVGFTLRGADAADRGAVVS
ncbi:MAG TPA: lipopolysaccharide heptosyltransferase II [Burkholderiales bacterium]|nr:lipopolysaccharide heptosyltransferase II [Burkholderiales bacterium]